MFDACMQSLRLRHCTTRYGLVADVINTSGIDVVDVADKFAAKLRVKSIEVIKGKIDDSRVLSP